jgi:hypothetical protein
LKRQIIGAVLATGIALAISAATVMPAAAATSGSESFRGTIMTSGVSGTRTVISSVVVAKGVFNGVGWIVETESLATDPPDSSRDDLVFPGGSMHIISFVEDFSFTINRNCLGHATIQQTGEIQGGTGSSPTRPAASKGRSRGAHCFPAARMAAAPSTNRRCTRWT